MGSGRFFLKGLSTVSSIGASIEEVDDSVARSTCRVALRRGVPVFELSPLGNSVVDAVARGDRFTRLDRVTHLALAAAQRTVAAAMAEEGSIGLVSIGSSRGATGTLERTVVAEATDDGRVPLHTSPSTTAGNISSWVAQEYLGARGGDDDGLAALDTSMTCSSAFHSLLVSLAFLRGGMATSALFGGAEACLTPYTLAQLEALRIYSGYGVEWPCRPGSTEGANSVVLGEGAGTAIITRSVGTSSARDLEVLGVGWGLERTPTATGVSEDGLAFEASMRRAVASLPAGRSVDCVIAHAPGTIKGDEAEVAAIRRVLGGVMTTTTKHLTGHTYGASGMVSLALAQSLIYGVPWGGLPYNHKLSRELVTSPRTVLINTAGFGGNSISVAVGPVDS